MDLNENCWQRPIINGDEGGGSSKERNQQIVMHDSDAKKVDWWSAGNPDGNDDDAHLNRSSKNDTSLGPK